MRASMAKRNTAAMGGRRARTHEADRTVEINEGETEIAGRASAAHHVAEPRTRGTVRSERPSGQSESPKRRVSRCPTRPRDGAASRWRQIRFRLGSPRPAAPTSAPAASTPFRAAGFAFFSFFWCCSSHQRPAANNEGALDPLFWRRLTDSCGPAAGNGRLPALRGRGVP